MKSKMLGLPVLVCWAVSSLAAAFPIEPRPLRRLVIESDLIVVARVEKIGRVWFPKSRWENGKATLRILSVLKGKHKGSNVSVYYAGNMACPNPAKYDEGTTVLAFLTLRERGRGYTTCGLSYGAKTLPDEALEVYVERVKELTRILAGRDRRKQARETTEWLVKCIESDATRWEGVIDLHGPSRVWSGPIDPSEPPTAVQRQLTDSQKQRLFFTLKRTPVMEDIWVNCAGALMTILARSMSDERLARIARRYGEVDRSAGGARKAREAIRTEFVRQFERTGLLGRMEK